MSLDVEASDASPSLQATLVSPPLAATLVDGVAAMSAEPSTHEHRVEFYDDDDQLDERKGAAVTATRSGSGGAHWLPCCRRCCMYLS